MSPGINLMESISDNRRAALAIAHPGHELKVYGWVCLAHPLVFVLTDGSGRTGNSRLSATTHVLGELKSEAGGIYGRFTDVEIYAAILGRDLNLFIALAEELAEAFVKSEIEYVVSDAIEGYNPAHDMCRVLADAAANLARRKSPSRYIERFDILLISKLSDRANQFPNDLHRVSLDEVTTSRKLESSRAYSELAGEVNRVISEEGAASLKTEYLWRAHPLDFQKDLFSGAPYYEQYGEQQAAAGYYADVIRYRQHFLPLAKGLMDYAVGCRTSAHARSNYQQYAR